MNDIFILQVLNLDAILKVIDCNRMNNDELLNSFLSTCKSTSYTKDRFCCYLSFKDSIKYEKAVINVSSFDMTITFRQDKYV